MNDQARISCVWWLLRITYGLYWGFIGIDKFFGFATESEHRVSQAALSLIPLTLSQLLQIVGIVEIGIALLILTWWPRLGMALGTVSMLLIVMNLLCMGVHFDIAIHGTTIALGMLAFLLLPNGVRTTSESSS